MKIIGFSGKKQSGKSTAVFDIMRRLRNDGVAFCELSFAAYLKEIASRCFRIDPALYETEAGKLTPICSGMTVREVLQYLGTDVIRRLDGNAWVNAWRASVEDWTSTGFGLNPDVIVVPDVRFPNEVEAIQSEGGVVIRLTRAPFAESDKHESETALDDFVEPGGSVEFDYVLDNSEMSIEQQNAAVWQLVTDKGWI